MTFVLQPWQLLIAILAGWSNRQQQEVIEYLRTENQILKEKLGKRRILLFDDQRRRLAVKGKVLGRKVLESVGTLFTPDTILRWHRLLVAQKWDFSEHSKKKPGRPPVPDGIRTLVVRLASENPTWGYDRIQGALANLGLTIADTTVGNILKAHGIEPAPIASGRPPGKHSSKPIGTYWRRSISRRSKSGPRTAWSPSTCSSSWNSPPAAFTSRAFPEKLPGRLPHLGLSRPAQRSLTLRPAYSLSRHKRPVASKAPTISLPPSPLRLLPAGTTVAGRDSHPLKMHAFARRTVF
jgi:hypothetical protein